MAKPASHLNMFTVAMALAFVAGVITSVNALQCYQCGQYNDGVGSITPCLNYSVNLAHLHLKECPRKTDKFCIVSSFHIIRLWFDRFLLPCTNEFSLNIPTKCFSFIFSFIDASHLIFMTHSCAIVVDKCVSVKWQSMSGWLLECWWLAESMPAD